MLLDNIQVAVDCGFKRVKLKVRRGWDPVVDMNADCTLTPPSVPGTAYKPVIERIARGTKCKRVIQK